MSSTKQHRVKVIRCIKDWLCSCGKVVKAGAEAYRIAGFQLCRSCILVKGRMFFGMKGWGKNQI